MFCAPGLILGGTESIRSCFHVLRSRTRVGRFRWRGVPFSRFTLPESFSVVPRASGPVFMFSAAGLIFGGTEAVGSHFHVLRSRTLFRRYRGHRVPFSCFARPDSFSVEPRASGPVFMFSAPRHVFGSTEGVESLFHILRSRTHFRQYRGRRVPFSCFARPDSFSAVSRALGPVFMLCANGLDFGGAECVGSRFLVLRARTRFRRYRGHQVPFSCFLLPDMFLRAPRASGRFFTFCASSLVFGSTEGVRSRFHVLSARTRFRQYQGRQVPFSSFALPDSISTV
jgi:hypothetical protein